MLYIFNASSMLFIQSNLHIYNTLPFKRLGSESFRNTLFQQGRKQFIKSDCKNIYNVKVYILNIFYSFELLNYQKENPEQLFIYHSFHKNIKQQLL